MLRFPFTGPSFCSLHHSSMHLPAGALKSWKKRWRTGQAGLMLVVLWRAAYQIETITQWCTSRQSTVLYYWFADVCSDFSTRLFWIEKAGQLSPSVLRKLSSKRSLHLQCGGPKSASKLGHHNNNDHYPIQFLQAGPISNGRTSGSTRPKWLPKNQSSFL